MEICVKHIIAFVILSVSMLLYCNMFPEPSTDSLPIELSAENNAVTDCASSDYDSNEEEKSTFAIPFAVKVKGNINHVYFHVTCSANQPFLSVWQPPKLS